MKISHIDLGEHPILLAPMEDVTDPAFRLMCKKFGADMVYTEFVSSDALIRAVSKTAQKLSISDEERPVAIQIYGKDGRSCEDRRAGAARYSRHKLRLPREESSRKRSRSRNAAKYSEDAGNYPCRSGRSQNTCDSENPFRMGRQQ